MLFHSEQQRKTLGVPSEGFSIPILEWEGLTPQAGYRLFIAVQPFDDVVANHTSRNSDDKGYNKFHSKHLLSLPV